MSYREMELTFTNTTGKSMSFASVTVNSGTTPTADPSPISDQATSVVTMEGSGGFGPSGTFQWNFDDGSGTFTFAYTHPVGASESSVTFTSIPGGFEVLTVSNDLNHHTATASYTLQPA